MKSEKQKLYNLEYQKKIRSTPEGKAENSAASLKSRSTLEGRTKANATSRNWAKQYPEKALARHHRYRAKKNKNGGSYTGEEFVALKEFYNFTCLACARQEPEIKLTADHVIPVSKPGGTSYIENIQPLCKSCNDSKGNRSFIDFRGPLMFSWRGRWDT